MPAKDPQMYAVTFTGADGDHLFGMTYTKKSQSAAERHAKHFAKENPIKSVIPISGPEELEAMKKSLLAANPARIPIDELTDGQPNRVFHDPSLLEPEAAA